jgi:hypothetical protein
MFPSILPPTSPRSPRGGECGGAILGAASGAQRAGVRRARRSDCAGQRHRLACGIDAEQVYINEYFGRGIEVPLGGNRLSGFGREKGLEALRSYCKIKSVAALI